MVQEKNLLSMLDMLSLCASKFVHVSNDVLKGERALQSKDTPEPDLWQTISILSSFINFVAEDSRVRYGHFAFDLEPAQTAQHQNNAKHTLRRMKLFWNCEEDDVVGELIDEHKDERKELISEFINNELKIKSHLSLRPDMFDENTSKLSIKKWNAEIRSLYEIELAILNEWDEIIKKQRLYYE